MHITIDRLPFGVGGFGVKERNVVEHMSVGDEQVAPAVVIVIEEAHAKSTHLVAVSPELPGEGRVRETAIAIVAVQAVVLAVKMRDDEIEPAVIVIVGGVSAHAGFGFAIVPVGDA